MSLYIDTTCWYRPFENHTIQARIDEQEAIFSILEENENSNPVFEILSCQMQVNQVYSKRNSLNTSPDEREVLQLIIDSIEDHTGNTTNNNPNTRPFLDSFLNATNLSDKEDARHILTAWVLGADYFLTTDYTTILNVNDNRQIENFLDSQIHPLSGALGNIVEIRNPIIGLAELRR